MHKLAIIFLLFSNIAIAIDKPEAPNYVAEFEKRLAPLYSYVREKASSTPEYARGYAEIEKALDGELNLAYTKLLSKLGVPEQKLLYQSQKAWLKFRDVEFKLIEENWSSAKFGTSSVISRGDYKASIIKNRVVSLLWYLKTFP